MHSRVLRYHLWPLLALLVAMVAVYGRLLGHDFLMNWDDNVYVTANSSVQGFSAQNIKVVFTSFYAGNYAPVQMLSYMLDYSIWGLWPGGFLLTNVLLHFMNGVMLYVLLIRAHKERLLAAIGASVFLLHPVQVESVAWISQRKNLLAMFFMLFAWEAYNRYNTDESGKSRLFYVVSVGAFLCALLSKSVVVIFPAAIMLYDFCFSLKFRIDSLLNKLPYILAAGIVAVIAIYSQSPGVTGLSGIDYGGRTSWHGGSFWANMLTMIPVFCRYVRLILWPSGLSAIYNPKIYTSLGVTVLLSSVVILLIIYCSIRLIIYDRRLGFWPFFSILAIIPVSQIVPLVTIMNDRYLYFPMIGLSALVAVGAVDIKERIAEKYRSLFYLTLFAIICIISVASYQRAGVWKDSKSLWADAVTKSPDRFDVWEGLGEAYHLGRVVDPNMALNAYQKSFDLYSSNPNNLYNFATLHIEHGNSLRGAALLNRLLTINPSHVMGWAALGDYYVKQGMYAAAEKAYKRAEQLQPEAKQVKRMLGALYVLSGNNEKARQYLENLETDGDGDSDTAFQLSCIEADAGHKIVSVMWLEKSLQRGFSDVEKILKNEHLRILSDMPEYTMLLESYFQRH